MGKSKSDFKPEDLKVFFQEANEQLQLLSNDIVRLEKEADNSDLLQEIFRAAHTLKGSSAMLGLDKMAELTHAMEDLLDAVRKGAVSVNSEIVDHLLRGLDALTVLKEDAAGGRESEIEVAGLAANLRSAAQPSSNPSDVEAASISFEAALAADHDALEALRAEKSGRNLYRIRVSIDPNSEWLAVRCFQVLDVLATFGEIVKSAPSREDIEAEIASHVLEAVVLSASTAEDISANLRAIDEVIEVEVEVWTAPEDVSSTAEEAATTSSAPGTASEPSAKIEALQTVRVDVERLDDLINMVGELAIEQTRLNQIMRDLRSRYHDDPLIQALSESGNHFGKVVDELDESMMHLRMVPVGTLFNQLPRLVRDLARSMGKKIDFIIEGQDTEIDRQVMERIKDPLVHLLRNSVDHGIEPPEVRAAAGKPEQGTIKLSARHGQGHIAIRLRDDGKGIDAASVRKAIVERGVVTKEVADGLTDDQAVQMIFESGVTTKQNANEISGRGIGMDVVKKAVEAINGMIQFATQPGMGTTITLRLPLDIATSKNLLVSAGDCVYALPVQYIQGTIKFDPSQAQTVMGKDVLNYRGTAMPIKYLTAFCRPGWEQRVTERKEQHAVLMRAIDKTLALVVDDLIEEEEYIIRSMSDFLTNIKGSYAGATILGDGRVVFMVDIVALMKTAA
jgi:two-component system chemotaxis sensor kinase CheA